jgi:hypothetical protein
MRALLKMLAILRSVNYQSFLAIFDLPDVNSLHECRVWCLNLIEVGASVADLTPTELDDQAVDALGKVVENDEAFKAFHALLVSMVEGGDEDAFVLRSSDAKVVGDTVGIDPLTIISLVVMLARLLLKLRG